MYNGNMATINVKAKKFVNLFFQTGALIQDRHGILQGDAAQVRTAHFAEWATCERGRAAGGRAGLDQSPQLRKCG